MARLPGLSANLNAVLDTIAWAEGTSTHELTLDDGYDIICNPGGRMFDYHDHPRKRVEYRPGKFSTAAGRYQLLARYFDPYNDQLDLDGTFSPENQDRIAIQQIKECRALNDIEAGAIRSAIRKICRIWASLPGAGYDQPERKMSQVVAKYVEYGGTVLHWS